MTLSMARCVGRAGCVDPPTSGRGLCVTCYARHHYRGTLDNFPTMRERTRTLRAQGATRVYDTTSKVRERQTIERKRQESWAERVELNGLLVHPNNLHGRLSNYSSSGCRGPMCYAAYRHYRVTGQGRLPEAFQQEFTAEDCVLYVSETYPDRRKAK